MTIATTGFWPVKNRLKETIDYANNPDKTTDRKYLDDDLAATLQYASDEQKTDQKMYVSGINCSAHTAYTEMMAVKHKYGERGCNIAYHGYQSFAAGEVTPEEAHEIGFETARRLWGERYQVVVTTHLNTDNIHNHFVLNSVSFVDGKKFRNKIGDHKELRRISDEICAECGKSVLAGADFYGKEKEAYWLHKKGEYTRKDIVRLDVKEALYASLSLERFEIHLKNLGYRFYRDFRYEHPSIIADGWDKPIRLDSLGKEFTKENINKHIYRNVYEIFPSRPPPKPTSRPLQRLIKQYEFEALHTNDITTMAIDILFAIVLTLIDLTADEFALRNGNLPISAEFRLMLTSRKQLESEFYLMKNNDLHTESDLRQFIGKLQTEIDSLNDQYREIHNRNRRPKTEEERQNNNAAMRELTAKMKPLKRQLKTAQSTLNRYPQIWELVKMENDLELGTLDRNKVKVRYK